MPKDESIPDVGRYIPSTKGVGDIKGSFYPEDPQPLTQPVPESESPNKPGGEDSGEGE